MYKQYEYYFNNDGSRNNLIYTSLVNTDKTRFIQWYYNDSEYHKGQNQVVDPELMQEKFDREVKYLSLMHSNYPDLVPNFYADVSTRKVYLDIDGKDFWNRASCSIENYNSVLPDWQEQMLEIIKAHKSLGLHKYSMHPSSYFIVDGKLKSFNYFFTYQNSEPYVSIKDVESHIHTNRQDKMKEHIESLGIKWNKPQPWEVMDQLCWNSFRTNYPVDFIEKALDV